MDKTTELSYKHLISQLRKENADLRNEVRELRKLLTRKGDKPPNNEVKIWSFAKK